MIHTLFRLEKRNSSSCALQSPRACAYALAVPSAFGDNSNPLILGLVSNPIVRKQPDWIALLMTKK